MGTRSGPQSWLDDTRTLVSDRFVEVANRRIYIVDEKKQKQIERERYLAELQAQRERDEARRAHVEDALQFWKEKLRKDPITGISYDAERYDSSFHRHEEPKRAEPATPSPPRPRPGGRGSPEWREKISTARAKQRLKPFKGHTHTPEARERISEAMKQRRGPRHPLYGGSLRDDWKESIAASKVRKPLTAEHRKSIREGLLRAHADKRAAREAEAAAREAGQPRYENEPWLKDAAQEVLEKLGPYLGSRMRTMGGGTPPAGGPPAVDGSSA